MPRPTKSPPDHVHNRLAVLRAERRISRQDLADAVGVHYQTIGYLEREEYSPTLALALRIAQYFSLPVEAVFSTEPFEPMSDTLYKAQGGTT
jgi:putative transcriptional regulator